ncbi:replication initiation protein [Laribacter hongkongensis]|uniref:replication initiation protein n=1 Tax=Laribacter hongkongensis TaxID=168471 RepID=UPI001EFDFDAA|nr:replication initiation protein [Laribacter hongkongensis]MCG9115921.1 replication initiation protein [Laribacter hongkongensis]
MASAALAALVEAHAPRRPYCADEKHFARIRPKVTALGERYIQLNPPAHQAWLILDIDRPGAALAWDDADLPPPTYVAINPENGHAHIGYALSSPVCTTDAARIAPMRYLAAIERAYTEKARADFAFAGSLAKNPLHPSWRLWEALQKFQSLDARLLLNWERRRQQRADFFAARHTDAAYVIKELTPDVIERISKHYESVSLNSDDYQRDEGHYYAELIDQYKQGYGEGLSALKAAVAIGDVEFLGPILQQFLDIYRYQVDLPTSDYRRLAIAFGRAAIRTNESLLRRYKGEDVQAPSVNLDLHMLFEVVDDYLKQYPSQKKAAMFKKLQTVMPLFKDIVGNKPIHNLRQMDIIRFLETIQKLPPRWSDICRQKKIKPAELATMGLGEMSPKTYDDTYKAAITPFLTWASTYWQDRGFPTTLTTKSINYTGSREAGEMQQRAFRKDELQRLFMGPEMRSFAEDATQAHQFWLPHLALFTGARVNELCQLNPKLDIRQDKDSGVWFLDITENTETDERVKKSVKTKPSKRKVPIHSQLVELGFLDYVKRVSGVSKLLFHGFEPSRGRAAPLAADWFGEFLRELGLRDETPGARLVGMHAFRSTFLNAAMDLGVVNAEAITGHAGKITGLSAIQNGQISGEASVVVRSYQGELGLKPKAEIVEKISFEGIRFFKPV